MTLSMPNEGTVARCSRCGDPCKVASDANPDAKMLRYAKEPKGLCVNCAVAEWFLVSGMREMHPGASSLRHKSVQDQFARVMFAHAADAKPPEINWEKVIANWDLPFRVGAKKMHDPKKDPTPPRTRRTSRRGAL